MIKITIKAWRAAIIRSTKRSTRPIPTNADSANGSNSAPMATVATTPPAKAPLDNIIIITSDHVQPTPVFSPTVDMVFLIPMKASWKA